MDETLIVVGMIMWAIQIIVFLVSENPNTELLAVVGAISSAVLFTGGLIMRDIRKRFPLPPKPPKEPKSPNGLTEAQKAKAAEKSR